jgi:hypothetical protein
MLSSDASAGFFYVLWLVWMVAGIVGFVVFYRGMLALAKIPDRLERIERELAAHRTQPPDDRAQY